MQRSAVITFPLGLCLFFPLKPCLLHRLLPYQLTLGPEWYFVVCFFGWSEALVKCSAFGAGPGLGIPGPAVIVDGQFTFTAGSSASTAILGVGFAGMVYPSCSLFDNAGVSSSVDFASPVSAVGVDLISLFAATTVTVEIFDTRFGEKLENFFRFLFICSFSSSTVPVATQLVATPDPLSPPGFQFFGVVSTGLPITRLTLTSPVFEGFGTLITGTALLGSE